jgi:hypothetical protein
MSWLQGLATSRSGKREVAVSLLFLWAFASAYIFFWIDSGRVGDYEGIYSTLTWSVLAWSAAAFGLDFAAKQGMLSPPPAPNKPAPRRREAEKMELL